ncbi:MAG: hypothetical protein WC781_05290 [Candidatus Pacearchaeota archaeon]|jgi:uncharacterized protein (UPF0332 family)
MRFKRPDSKNALSILESAKKQMKFTLSLKISAESGETIIRNIYECFRMLGDALLIKKGIESQDHLEPLNELSKLKVLTSRPINIVDTLRVLRHNINYYGYTPKIEEVEYAVNFSKDCFEELSKAVLNEISK